MLKTISILFVSCPMLRGKVDISGTYLIDKLNSAGFQIEKLCVVCENENVVANELNTLTKHSDFVIVVSDLANNVVLKAVASISNDVFDSRRELCNKLVLTSFTKVLCGDNATLFVIYFCRIFILRADVIEELYENVLEKHLKQYKHEMKFKKYIHIPLNGNIKAVLEKVYKYQIHIEKKDQMLVLILEKHSFEEIVECEISLRKELTDTSMEVNENIELFNMIYENKDDFIQLAIKYIEECLTRYGLENIFLCFNGGKDCTVLLHLIYVVIKVKYPNYKSPIFCLYIKPEHTFPEQDKFIRECMVYYNLEIMDVSLGMKETLNMVLSKKPNLKACLMGTRRTDPFSKMLNTFQMTDSDWPQVMRVNPLLDWRYYDIWDYLLYYKIPYCKLYDQGFTSLGSAANTTKNPSLLYHDLKLNQDIYLPAYKLLDQLKERDGRKVIKDL